MYFLLDVLQISPVVKNCYFMDRKAEKDITGLGQQGDDIWFEKEKKKAAKIRVNNDDILLPFYLLVTCMLCYCHTVLLGTQYTKISGFKKYVFFAKKI
jgi:hypothetical protein